MDDTTVHSPDGRLQVRLEVEGGVAGYRIWHDATEVLSWSPLGLELSGHDLASLRLSAAGDLASVEQAYRMIGVTADLTVVANERVYSLLGPDEENVSVTVRVTDDAVGIRYGWDGGDDRIAADRTGFRFARPGNAWIQPHDPPSLGAPAYEAPYENGVPIGTPTTAPSWNLPALFESGDRWVLLAESAVEPGNFAAHLISDGARGYRITLPQTAEGLSDEPPGEPISSPWTSPWRLVVVSETLAGVYESTAVSDFAEPARIGDTAWIEPGRASWSWWSDHSSPMNPVALRGSIDLAGDLGWEYTLIDANWNLLPERELLGLVDHARSRGVGVLLWYNSGGSNNVVPEEPRDRMHDPVVRRQEFARLAAWGVAGVKVDFFHSDRVDIIGRYHAIAADAAEAGLIVNFHGCTAPKGWERTWPNVVTMEAVRGAEQYFFAEDHPEVAIWHNTVLPFTRNVVGSMDYTPVTFSNQRFARETTAGHELALAVAFQSRLQHFADSASSYRAQKAEVWRYLSEVPAVWDESRLVGGYPGEWFVVARRHGDRWWMSGINGPLERDLRIDLDPFPGLEGGEVIAGPGLSVSVAPAALELTLAPGDGFSLWTPTR